MIEKTLEVLEPSLKKDFVQIPTKILHNPKLSPQAKTLYTLLISYAWYNAECFPGQSRLSQSMGVSVRTINTYLNELKKHKLLTWKQRGLNKTNLYKLLKIPATFDCYEREFLEWKPASGQDRKNTSSQEWKPASDKVYKDELYKEKTYEGDNGSFKKKTSSPSVYKFHEIPFANPLPDNIYSTIEFYLQSYKNKTGKEHPRLNADQWGRVFTTLVRFDEDKGGIEDTWWFELVDNYIYANFKSKDVDYNINHFATEGILEKRFLEVYF